MYPLSNKVINVPGMGPLLTVPKSSVVRRQSLEQSNSRSSNNISLGSGIDIASNPKIKSTNHLSVNY